ncbi:hypothetical protein LOD99_5868 [Oopsacas minuta]|uniref:WD repeat-containing protein 54 beta-propeller domain-containing protein n=1 Tax=Oopsacas minuta TaxID=111878 RepID=A0AAV7JP12_9METZ|nr:hypothetical protein LOD99_5868 [Oopsacas minuta]
MYTQKTVIPLKLSPSYLLNNLSISSMDNSSIKYGTIHKNTLNLHQHAQPSIQIVYNPESFPHVLDFRTIQPNPFILQAKWCIIGSSVCLVLCCYHIVLIYDESGSNLLSVHPTVYVADKHESTYAKGIAVYENFLCIGWGNGEMIVYQIQEKYIDGRAEISFERFATLTGHSEPIASLCTDATGCLVSGDDTGMVCVWKLKGIEGMSDQTPNIVVKTSDSPCTGVAMCGDFIIASFGSGKIEIWGKTSLELKFEINAHARWINSIDVCHKKRWLIAVSEDTCVSVWQLPRDNSGVMECLHYQAVQSCMLTGCQFLDEDGIDFALTAYDHNEILIYSLVDNEKDLQ